MTIQERFEHYEKYRGELEADICLLREMLGLDLPDPEGNLKDLGQLLKRLQSSLDFINNEHIEKRMEHAWMRFSQLSSLDWAIQSRPTREREILECLIVNRLTWDETADHLHIGRRTVQRLRRKAFDDLDQLMAEDPDFKALFSEEDA